VVRGRRGSLPCRIFVVIGGSHVARAPGSVNTRTQYCRGLARINSSISSMKPLFSLIRLGGFVAKGHGGRTRRQQYSLPSRWRDCWRFEVETCTEFDGPPLRGVRCLCRVGHWRMCSPYDADGRRQRSRRYGLLGRHHVRASVSGGTQPLLKVWPDGANTSNPPRRRRETGI
jgi:hypothetical protein